MKHVRLAIAVLRGGKPGLVHKVVDDRYWTHCVEMVAGMVLSDGPIESVTCERCIMSIMLDAMDAHCCSLSGAGYACTCPRV